MIWVHTKAKQILLVTLWVCIISSLACNSGLPDDFPLDTSFVKGKVVGTTSSNPKDLAVFDLQTKQVAPITDELKYYESSLAWTKHGSQILFTKWSDSLHGRGLHIMEANGANQRLLWSVNKIGDIDVSNDGEWIIYTRNDNTELWIARVNGSDRQQLAGPGFYRNPEFSPEGDHFAVRVSWGHLHVMDLSNNSIVLQLESVGTNPVSWSPDGNYIVTASNSTFFSSYRLFVIDVRTGAETEVLNGDESLRALTWLSNGDHILYANASGAIQVVQLSSLKTSQLITGVNGNMEVFIE